MCDWLIIYVIILIFKMTCTKKYLGVYIFKYDAVTVISMSSLEDTMFAKFVEA